MKIIIDTSAYSNFNRGDINLRKWFITSNELLIPIIVIGELKAGFKAGNKSIDNDSILQRFIDSSNVNVINLSDSTTNHYAEIFIGLRKLGKPIGTNDMWIAALSLEHKAPLLTSDTHFKHIKNLKILGG